MCRSEGRSVHLLCLSINLCEGWNALSHSTGAVNHLKLMNPDPAASFHSCSACASVMAASPTETDCFLPRLAGPPRCLCCLTVGLQPQPLRIGFADAFGGSRVLCLKFLVLLSRLFPNWSDLPNLGREWVGLNL